MKQRNLLCMIGILLLGGILLMNNTSYADNPASGDETVIGKGAVEKKNNPATKPGKGKRSALNGGLTLASNSEINAGKEFTFKEYMELRRQFGIANVGPDYEISDDMGHRELNDWMMLGTVERTGTGSYRVIIPMTEAQLISIDQRFQREIPLLAKTDPDPNRNGQKIGLNSYDLNRVAKLQPVAELIMKKIVGEVMLTGEPIVTTNTNAAYLNGITYEKVVTLTEKQIIGNRALSKEDLSKKTQNVGKSGVKLAIATTRKLEPDAKGELSAEDQTYVMSVLSALPMGSKAALDLLEQKDIVFSYISSDRMDIFAQIEGMPRGVPSALNNLSPEQAKALVNNI
jgi:hypothetical protein